MPCDEVRRRVKAAPEKKVMLAPNEPFARAARKAVMDKGRAVGLPFEGQVLVQPAGNALLTVYVKDVSGSWVQAGTLDDLHDMALAFVPEPAPGSPMTVE